MRHGFKPNSLLSQGFQSVQCIIHIVGTWKKLHKVCSSRTVKNYANSPTSASVKSGISRNHTSWNCLTPYWSALAFWKIKFEKSSSTNWICNMQKSISKLIFAGYTGSKNPVRNRLKIQFVELDFSNLIFPTWCFKNQVQMDRAFVGDPCMANIYRFFMILVYLYSFASFSM